MKKLSLLIMAATLTILAPWQLSADQTDTSNNEYSLAADEPAVESAVESDVESTTDATTDSATDSATAEEQTETVEHDGSGADEQLDFDNEAIQKMFKQLEEQMNKAKEALTPEKRAELDRLEEETKELGIKLNNLHAELADFQTTKAAQKEEVKALRQRLAALQQEKAEQAPATEGEEDAEVVAAREKLDAAIAAVEEELAQKRAVKKETKNNIQAHEEVITSTQEEMSAKHEAMPTLPWGDENIDFDAMFAGGDASFEENVEELSFQEVTDTAA